MTCENCNSERVMSVGTRSRDMHWYNFPWLNEDYDGYALGILVGEEQGGDKLSFDICLDCGNTSFDVYERPISDEEILERINA